MLKVLIILCLLLHSTWSQEEGLDQGEHDDECLNQIDVMILLDGSFSVKKHNFKLVKDWVKQVVLGLNIDHGNIQVGVVQYSHYYRNRGWNRQKYIKTEIELGQYDNVRDFDAAVDRIKYQGYKTYTAHALNKTFNFDFVGPNNRYPQAKRAVILMTDGKATDSADLPGVIKRAEQEMGVVIYAVGIGKFSPDELRLITGNETDRIFELANFKDLKHIVLDLQVQLQKACDCNMLGSVNGSCNKCTQQCDCKTNVVGRRCNQCAAGSYGFGSEDGCLMCQCNPSGTNDPLACDEITGQCDCKTDKYIGLDCGSCAPGFYGFPNCQPCECGGFATRCDLKSGVCQGCTFGRRGDNCELCPVGFFMDEQNSECTRCSCNGNINSSDPEACDPISGVCRNCLHNTTGDSCEKCQKFFYGDASSQSCQSCTCNLEGTLASTCNGKDCVCEGTGDCKCLPNVEGKSCDRCSSNTWQMRAGRGCVTCGCSEMGTLPNTTCDPNNGQCVCKEKYVGMRCNECGEGFSRDGEDSECEDKPAGDEPEDIEDIGGDVPFFPEAESKDEEPTPAPDTTTTTTTTRTPRRKPLPVNPGWSHCVGCGGKSAQTWPSFCHGWLCRRRWPYHQQLPSTQRCYSGNWRCRTAVEQYGSTRHNPRYSYDRYNRGMYGGSRPAYYRGYYHHQRAYQPRQLHRTTSRFNLYRSTTGRRY